jgi:YceI-like domain
MPLPPGSHTLGPEDGTLLVRTGKGGAASKAGHNLVMVVTRWQATLAPEAVTLTADSRSLRVRDGSGGISPLGDEEKAGIAQTIDEDVLKGGTIEFRSSLVEADGDRVAVQGDLDLLGASRPLSFDLVLGPDGHLSGSARVKQTDWKMKPFSALFGTLKVADVVEVAVDVQLPTESDTDG